MMTSALRKKSNLTQRIVAAVIGAFILVFASVWSEWGYFAVFFMITLFSMLEFYKLVGLDGYLPLKFWGTFTALAIFSLTFLIELEWLPISAYFVIPPIASVTFFIKLYRQDDAKPFTNIALTFLGILYVGIPFSLMNLTVLNDGEYFHQLTLGILLLLWASDTGAYIAGTLFGKTKLFERISPKKSWEGSLGGALLALITALVYAHYFNFLLEWQWITIAGIIVIAGTYGDLVESLFKRSIEIKDSGTSIPGHGGFLDRFDALLLSIPFIAAFVRFI